MNSQKSETEAFGASNCSFSPSDYRSRAEYEVAKLLDQYTIVSASAPVENWQIDHDTMMAMCGSRLCKFLEGECRIALREGRLTGGNPDAVLESFSYCGHEGTLDPLSTTLVNVR